MIPLDDAEPEEQNELLHFGLFLAMKRDEKWYLSSPHLPVIIGVGRSPAEALRFLKIALQEHQGLAEIVTGHVVETLEKVGK